MLIFCQVVGPLCASWTTSLRRVPRTCVVSGVMVVLGLWQGIPASAQTESRLAEQAIHCAAVMTVLAQTADPASPQVQPQVQPHSARLQQAVRIFTDVYLKERNAGLSPENAVARRAVALADLKSTWTTRASAFAESSVICGAWADGFLEQGAWYAHVPVYPKVVALHTRQYYQALAEAALKQGPP